MRLKRLPVWLAVGLSLVLVACGGAESPPPAPPPPTAPPTEPVVVLEPTATLPEPTATTMPEPTATTMPEPTAEPVEPTVTTAPAEPTEAPAEPATTEHSHLVFLVLGPNRPELRWISAEELALAPIAGGNSTLQPSGLPVSGDVQVVGDRAYLSQEGTVVVFSPDGQTQPLDFVASTQLPPPVKPFLVSPSGRQIAWVEPEFEEQPGTRRNVLSVAGIDGSDARVVWELGEHQPGFLQPLGWNEAAGLLYLGLTPVMFDQYLARDQPGALKLFQVDISGESGRPWDQVSETIDCGQRACLLGVSPDGTQFASVEYSDDGAPARLIVGDTAPGGAQVWDLPAGLQSISGAAWLTEPGQLAVKALTQNEQFQVLGADLGANTLATWYEGESDVTPRLFLDGRRLLVVGPGGGQAVGGLLATSLLTPNGSLEPVAPDMTVVGSGTAQP